MSGNKVHPETSVSNEDIAVSKNLEEVNRENSSSESKVPVIEQKEQKEQKEPEDNGPDAPVSTPTKKIFNRKTLMNKYASLAPRPRVGTAAHALRYRASSSIATGRSRRSGSELDDVAGGSLASEGLEKKDWKTSRWRWPNEEQAKTYGREHLFEHGDARLCVSDDAFQKRLGVGIVLYFDFLKVTAIMFGVLTFLSIPMLVFTAASNRIEQEFQYDGQVKQKDLAWFMASLTVGNLGTDRLSWADRQKCTVDGNLWDYNGTEIDGGQCGLSKVTVFGVDVPMTDVAYIFQIVDVIIVFVYLVYTAVFNERVKKIRADTDRRQLTVSDYAIYVEGVPPETQREDIRDHFEKLYSLDKSYTWEKRMGCCNKRRLPVDDYVCTHPPIRDDTFSHFDPTNHVYNPDVEAHNKWSIKGGYIAEVSMARRKGDLINSFSHGQKLLLKIKRLRATIKKYGGGDLPSLKHPNFEAEHEPKWMEEPKPDRKKYTKAEANLAKCEKMLEDVTKIGRESKHKHECVGAYIIFDHVESARRCLDDYTTANNWIGSLLMPEELRFKISEERLKLPEYKGKDGKTKKHLLNKDGTPKEFRIKVTPAPEPNTIMWENLEIRGVNKFCRRVLSIVISLVCIFVSVLIITAAKTLRDQAQSETAPNNKLCPSQAELPEDETPHLASMYFSGYENAMSAGFVTRPFQYTEELLENRLDGLIGGTTMNYDEMCNPSSVASGGLEDQAFMDSVKNSRVSYYFKFENWERPSWLYPVWVCADSEAVCWPEIDKHGKETWTVPGMKDDDFNGVVDDGLCRWHPDDVVEKCETSTHTDTVEPAEPGAGTTTKPASCLRPTDTKKCKAGAVVLRWNVLPMHPFDRGDFPSTPSETIEKATGLPRLKKVGCRACSDLQYHKANVVNEKGEYIAHFSDYDKRYCCKERDMFAEMQTFPSQLTTFFAAEIKNDLVDALTDFGPLDRSNIGGPKREKGPTRTDGSYVFNKRGADDPKQFPALPYKFSPDDDQNDALRKAYEKFTVGPCSHPCTFINNTNLVCPTLSCVSNNPKHSKVPCKQYTTTTLSGCYCDGKLRVHKTPVSLFWAMVGLAISEDTVCRSYVASRVQGTLASNVALVIVVSINIVLARVLRALAKLERPANWSNYFTTASVLIFWSRFINVAWIIMLVNAESPGPNTTLETRYPAAFSLLRSFFLFRGNYRDFRVDWYQNVGTALLITLLLNIVEPHVVPMVKWLLMRLKIAICRRNRVMQYDLNMLYVGYEFEPEVRYPQVLNTIFVTLWFAGAMPLALFFATLALLITYFVDRLLLLRVYANHTIAMLDGSLAAFISQMLPLAAVFHLFITIYIYGSNDVMYDLRWGKGGLWGDLLHESTKRNLSSAALAIDAYKEFEENLKQNDPFDLIPRISRVNTIGLVILLVLVVIALALRNIIEPLVHQALAACGFLKAYQPREDGDGNDSVSITAKDIEVQGVDKWTKQCSVPYTGTWHIKVMKAHYNDFVKFYHDLGEPPESWKKVKVTREKSRARVFESHNHVGDAPTHNKVCCLELKPKQSEEEIEWITVKQVWLETEMNLGTEKHKIGKSKKTWEVCGCSGSYSYFMYLNPSYELALSGVAAELNLDLGGDLLETSVTEESVEEMDPNADINALNATAESSEEAPAEPSIQSNPPSRVPSLSGQVSTIAEVEESELP